MPPLTELPPSLQGSLPICHWAHGVGSVGLDGSKGLHGAGKQQRLPEGVDGREGQSAAAPGGLQ